MELTFQQVEEARTLLGRYLPKTRLVPAPSLARGDSEQVLLKLESELPTNSFKVRGAIYALAVNLQRRDIKEVVASSTGNHGAAVAYAARLFGIRAKVFLPVAANAVKRTRIEECGAEIVEVGADLAETSPQGRDYARKTDTYFLDDATDPDLPAGPAIIACEILEDVPAAGSIWVPVGDTALIRGLAFAAKHLKPTIRVVGVQANQAPAYYLSWKEGRAIPTDSCTTIADGLATRTPVMANVQVIQQLVDEMILVSEDQMVDAIGHLLLRERIVAEPAGAAALAAFMHAGERNQSSSVILVTGSNVSPAVLSAALDRGGRS